MTSVTCPTDSFCTAVDEAGNELTYTNGTPAGGGGGGTTTTATTTATATAIATTTLTTSATAASKATATMLRASRNPTVTGARVTYTATVSPAPAAGAVSFTEGGSQIPGCGSVKVGAGGTAQCTTRYGFATRELVNATYFGTGGFAASASRTVGENVRWSITVHGRVSGAGGHVKPRLSCAAGSGGCRVAIKLNVQESSPGTVLSLQAQKSHGKRVERLRTVVVGAKRMHLAAGHGKAPQINLNAAGKRLIRRLGQLPVQVAISVGGRSALSQNVTVRGSGPSGGRGAAAPSARGSRRKAG
jgi:hypothetical protein